MKHIGTIGMASIAMATSLAAQTGKPSFFVSTVGKDTTSIEQVWVSGQTVTGDWITAQGAILHHYVFTLKPDGTPAKYELVLQRPKQGPFMSVTVTYDHDSATFVTKTGDSTVTNRVAARHAYPVLGSSVGTVEAALMRMKASHAESGVITVHFPSRPLLPPATMPVKFVGADSARLTSAGGTIFLRVDGAGHVLGQRAGSQELKRVPGLDMAGLAARFAAALTK
jgi:hypothetical protein